MEFFNKQEKQRPGEAPSHGITDCIRNLSRRGGALRRLAVFVFIFIAASACAAGVEGPGASGRVRPVLAVPQLPDPSSWSAMGWVLAALAGLVVMVGSLAGVVLTVLNVIDRIRGKRTEPQEIKQPVVVRADVSFVPENDFKKFEAYVHEKNHDLAGQIQHLELAAEERRTEAAEQQSELMEKLQALSTQLDGRRSVSVANLHDQLKSAELKLASVETKAETLTQQCAAQFATIDQKLTNILREMPRRTR